jgi:hypothetical protein
VIPDARELVAIATETEHHGQLGLERESHNEAEAAPDGQLLVTQHPQQLAIAQPETSRHRSPDNRSQGPDAQGHDAQGVERPLRRRVPIQPYTRRTVCSVRPTRVP